MGQHRTNPTAIAAARGDISKSDRQRPARVGSRFAGAVSTEQYFTARDGSIRRRVQKRRGKANVKRAKKTRAARWARQTGKAA